tara:strand:- start:180 stop:611 length:432 start_codon:yes stop_codon:yes gene_type:complete
MFYNLVFALLSVTNLVSLPPVNNIYIANIKVPVIGNQYIEYERFTELESEIRMKGIINNVGYIKYKKENKNHENCLKPSSKNLYSYELNDNLKNILNKYRCELKNPSYDPNTDIASINILVRLVNFNKLIILKNINTNNSINQ